MQLLTELPLFLACLFASCCCCLISCSLFLSCLFAYLLLNDFSLFFLSPLVCCCFLFQQSMEEQAFAIVQGLYETVYNELGLGFQTPEALNQQKRYRSLGYTRPLAIWAVQVNVCVLCVCVVAFVFVLFCLPARCVCKPSAVSLSLSFHSAHGNSGSARRLWTPVILQPQHESHRDMRRHNNNNNNNNNNLPLSLPLLLAPIAQRQRSAIQRRALLSP